MGHCASRQFDDLTCCSGRGEATGRVKKVQNKNGFVMERSQPPGFNSTKPIQDEQILNLQVQKNGKSQQAACSTPSSGATSVMPDEDKILFRENRNQENSLFFTQSPRAEQQNQLPRAEQHFAGRDRRRAMLEYQFSKRLATSLSQPGTMS
jgi:hypothetical protein